mmetsp:Transcript_2928/g.383  ORF Transcript_2928/g.383 Transcript_2928/m.383 type:complete len:165 (+) Transcript_2928:165-659(+)
MIVYVCEGGIDYEAPTNIFHKLVIGNTLGYLLYDAIYGEVYHVHDMFMRFHHLMGIIGAFAIYYSANTGSIGVLSAIVGEISNPFMLYRHILKTEGKDNTAIFKFVEYTFVTLFVFNRSVIGNILIFNTWSVNNSFPILMAATGLQIVGMFWVYVIMSMVSKRL